MPVGFLSVISRTSPFCLAVLSHFFVGEKVTKLEILGMIVCFVALILITFSDSMENGEKIENNGSYTTRVIGILLAFIFAWLVAGTLVFNRALKGTK